MTWLRLPDNWPQPVAAAVTLLLLTALDVIGTIAAKEAVERRSVMSIAYAAIGTCGFVMMWWIFASSLRLNGLVVITVGWCVLVQVAVLFLNHFTYGEELPPGKLIAVVLAIAAQVYLLVGPGPERPEETSVRVPAISAYKTTVSMDQQILATTMVGQQSGAAVAVRSGRHVAPAADQPRPAHASGRPVSASVYRPGRHAAIDPGKEPVWATGKDRVGADSWSRLLQP
jgi:hypothetical protein